VLGYNEGSNNKHKIKDHKYFVTLREAADDTKRVSGSYDLRRHKSKRIVESRGTLSHRPRCEIQRRSTRNERNAVRASPSGAPISFLPPGSTWPRRRMRKTAGPGYYKALVASNSPGWKRLDS